MSKHTPGPWVALITKPRRGDPGPGTTMVKAGGSMAIECSNSGDTFAECAANAHLTAAAPEMYAALQTVCALMSEDKRTKRDDALWAAYSQVVAALAKAGGHQ